MSCAELSMHQVGKFFFQGSSKISILDNITVSFSADTTYAITGISGTGKSTFMHILAGIDTPSHGTVCFNGINISTLTRYERSLFLSQSIGLLFQQPYLIAELSVIENIIIPGLIRGISKQESFKRAQELLLFLHLADKIHAKPSSLSGGQQQRVALARALFNKPAFLLADEPTGSLDTKTAGEIVDFLLMCCQTWSMGLVVSTHDRYLASAMDEIYEIKNGMLCKTVA